MTEYELNPRRATSSNPLVQLFLAMKTYRNLWLLPLLLGTVVSIAYAYLAPKKYEARQTLMIRDDLIGESYKPGRFESQESLKSAQETLLEIARRPKVIRSVLKRLGPANDNPTQNWPDDDTIESTQGLIQVRAPNGEELGKTETIILAVKAESRERAAQFVTYLLDEIEREWNAVRRARFQSMASELRQGTNGARSEFEVAAKRLQAMEESVGADLADLRGLNDAQTGSNGLRQTLTEVKSELREAKRKLESTRHQRNVLLNAYSDPEYSATPVELLESQPELAYLKQGLNDARLRLANNLGRFNETHPLVASDRAAIADLKKQIHDHLKAALDAIDAQLDERQRHYDQLRALAEQYTQRLDRLSAMRVEYEKLVQDYDNKLAVYRELQENLTRVEALASPETHVSLLTPIDEPQISANPVGPSKKTIVLGGFAASFVLGLGLVLLFAPLDIVELSAPASTARQGDHHVSPSSPDDRRRNRADDPSIARPISPTGSVSPDVMTSSEVGRENTETVTEPANSTTVSTPKATKNAKERDAECDNSQPETTQDNGEAISPHNVIELSADSSVAPPEGDHRWCKFELVDSARDLPLAQSVVISADPTADDAVATWAMVTETPALTIDDDASAAIDSEASDSTQLKDTSSTEKFTSLADDLVGTLTEEWDALLDESWHNQDVGSLSPGDVTAGQGDLTMDHKLNPSDQPEFVQPQDNSDSDETSAENATTDETSVPMTKNAAQQLLADVPPIDSTNLPNLPSDSFDAPVSIDTPVALSDAVDAHLAKSICANVDDTTLDVTSDSSPVDLAPAPATSVSPEFIESPTQPPMPEDDAEAELEPWTVRIPEKSPAGKKPDSDRRDDSKTGSPDSHGQGFSPHPQEETNTGGSDTSKERPSQTKSGHHESEETADAGQIRKVKPLRISELKEHLENMERNNDPHSTTEDSQIDQDGDGYSIDQQIERLSESLMKFCQAIQMPATTDDPDPSPTSTENSENPP